MAVHELKTWPAYFDAVLRGDKTFEVRVDDRGGFGVGDVLVLREWSPDSQAYTARSVAVRVRYVLRGGEFGVAPGYVVMGISSDVGVSSRRRSVARVIADSFVLTAVAAGAALVLARESLDARLLLDVIVLALVAHVGALYGRAR